MKFSIRLLLFAFSLVGFFRLTSPASLTGAVAIPEEWLTPAEKAGYRATPRYSETLAYLEQLGKAAPTQLRMESIGKSPQGRDLWLAIVSRDGTFDPRKAHAAGRPVLLVQNAIHAGEMDGKDACLALLRDVLITREKASLLGQVVLLVLPIYNVDGHERFGPYNRINQNGPEEMGWRTQAANLNLNRDYVKADAPETRAFLGLWSRWLPDFFVDNHVTDGADFQYDITYAMGGRGEVDPRLADWQEQVLLPFLEERVNRSGHVWGPYIALKDENNPARGLQLYPSPGRFSHGYAALQNRPGLLLELHMVKDYRTRVLANYETLCALLEVLNREATALVQLNREMDQACITAGKPFGGNRKIPLSLASDGKTIPFRYRGFRFQQELSPISGALKVEYRQEPVELEIPRENSLKVIESVNPPLAYIVPRQWQNVLEVLASHGLKLLRTTSEWNGEVETYRFRNVRWQPAPYEGRQVVQWEPVSPTNPGTQITSVREVLHFPAGSAVIPLDQRAAKVAIQFLEPQAPDSAVSWGFFNTIFEQKEYAEPYVLEKLAREMLERDPALKKEFETKVATDRAFASSARDRLNFFFERSPWYDKTLNLYPVGRLLSLEGVPVAKEPE